MEPNHNGRVHEKPVLAFLDGDDFFKELEQLESVAGPTQHQPFPHRNAPSSSLPYHQQLAYGHSKYPNNPHQAPCPPYYPHNNQHFLPQNYQNPQASNPQNYHAQPSYLNNQPQPIRQIRPNPGPYQYQPHPFPAQPPPQVYRPPQFSHSQPSGTPTQPQSAYPHDYHTPTPFADESPMQRMQQLATAQHGGPLAASAAAAAAADEAQATRRISPDGRSRGRRSDGEVTVRDVLHRQYIEQRRQLEMSQMHQMHPQSYQSRFPNPSLQSSIIPPDQSTPTLPSMNGASTLSDVPRFDSPSAPPTPIFSFPLVTPTATVTPLPPPVANQPPNSGPRVAFEAPEAPAKVAKVEPLGALDTDAQKAELIQRLKTAHVMSELEKANTAAMASGASVEKLSRGALHKAANVVRRLEAKQEQPTSSSTRKRPLDETSSPPPPTDTAEPPLEPGPRIEINENGEPEKKVYMLVRYCNPNDPEHNPKGVLKTMDQIKKEKEKGDMISVSYTSHIMPYEMVDFRIKKPDGYVDTAAVATAAPVKEGIVPAKLQ